jgi:hypothetical protein
LAKSNGSHLIQFQAMCTSHEKATWKAKDQTN